MRQWNFYFSGILYGVLTEDGGQLFHRPLNPFTGELKERSPLTDDSFYHLLCKRRLLPFFAQRAEYERLISRGQEAFLSGSGEFFHRRADGAYIQRRVKFPMDLLVKDGEIFAVQMPGRDFTAVLVLDGREEETVLREWGGFGPLKGPVRPVLDYGSFQVPTRDGELLATDVYLPGGIPGPYPAVLARTPYGKAEGREQYYRYVQRGYAVVIQDVRGREDSTGQWIPNYYEAEDGDDTLNWIASRSWSDGSVGMTGGSYLGYVQWAAAATGNPHLKAILSSVCAGSPFTDLPRRGGCFNSGMLAWAFAMTEKRMRDDLMRREDWDEVLDIRPLSRIPRKALGRSVPFLDLWLSHPDYDDFWKRSNWLERSQGRVVPALIMSGWFDDNGMGTTEALDLVNRFYPEGTYHVVLGPWMHSGNANYDLHGFFIGENALRYDMDILCLSWLEHFLKGVENGIEAAPAVEYYTLGENRWKSAARFPVPGAQPAAFYLSEENGRGILTRKKPERSGSDSFDYDPENPAVHIVDMSENELEVPENYAAQELRPDVLCYSTPALASDLTVTGDIAVTLFVSSDCPDTDFVVRLTDVFPDGTSAKLADGVLSARYRNGFEHPEFMAPGEVYELRIRTTKISNRFRKGHRLRFTVTSSAKNFIFPNSNTEQGFDSEVTRRARNTIHRGGEYASRILLPLE